MIGKKYGRLTVIDTKKDEKGYIHCLCTCDCGNELWVYASNLTSGKTKSCKCYQKENLKKRLTKTNEYYVYDNYVIGITNNTQKEFYIDLDDYEKVRKISWYEANTGYITHKDSGVKCIQLHRYVTNAPKELVVDHINHNRKDNRKCNLRICTQRENMLNRKTKPNGICKIKRNNNTYYIVQLLGKYRGCFKNKEDAIKKRDKIYQEEYFTGGTYENNGNRS